MTYNYNKLVGKIVEVYGTQGKFADEMDLSERSVSLKLNNKRPWTQPEIEKARSLLDIPYDQLGEYFFNQKVQSN